MSTMEFVTANRTGKVVTKTWRGREYFVAPMSIIVPGVLNGSKGPLLYPEDEVQAHPGLWNGVPITNGHPKVGGSYVSARDPDVLEQFQIGWAFNDRYENGKRMVDAWVDKELAKAKEPRIFDALSADKELEQSTGLFTQDAVANEGANWKGVPYAHIARNYRSDHIAILVDAIGACSRRDGCGLNVNQASLSEQLSEWLGGLKRWLTLGGVDAEIVDNALPNQPRSSNTGQYKPPGSGSGKGETHSAAQTGAAQLTDADRTLAAAVQNGTMGVDAEAWAAAMAEAKDDAELAAHIYTRKGGTASEVINVDKAEKVTYIVTNCSCYEEKDKEVLNKLSESTLDSIIADFKARVTVNATVDECKKMLKDMEAKQNQAVETATKAAVAAVQAALEAPRRTAAIAKLTANAKDAEKPALVESFGKLDTATLEVLAANTAKVQVDGDKQPRPSYFGASGTANTGTDEDFNKDDVLPLTPTFTEDDFKTHKLNPRKVA
jgi:hypothetical protein